MNFTAIVLPALAILPVTALVTWLWFAMTRVNRELSALTGFEGMHFEMCSTEERHR